jgi:hypothetical protein
MVAGMFYEKMNQLLGRLGFGRQVEALCEQYNSDASLGGRSSPPASRHVHVILLTWRLTKPTARGLLYLFNSDCLYDWLRCFTKYICNI